MKKALLLLLAFSMLLGLCACGDSSAESGEETTTITDHAGYEITVPVNIERIAVCDIYPLPSVLSVFFGSAEKLVGIAPASRTAAENGLLSTLYPEILNADSTFFDGTNVNLEALLALKPDVVFYSAENTAIGEQLRNAGFAAVGISARNWGYDAIETLNQWIATLAELFPANEDRAKLVSDYSKKIYDDVQSRVAGIAEEDREDIFFLFQYSDAAIATSGAHFFGQWWADAVGARNVGEELDTQKSTAINIEQIYAWNPTKILITNFNKAQPADLYGNTVGSYDWSGVDAIINEEVYKMPLGMYRSYTCGVDTPITLYWMAKVVYPGQFEDIDITEEVKKYYREVFNLDLTDEQAESIFAPISEASAF